MSSLIHVTSWERVSLWRRVPCAFLRVGVLVLAVIVLISLLGPPLAIFFTARWEAKKMPNVWVTQQPLTNYEVSKAPGTKLSYFGYEFEVPWTGDFKKRGGGDGQSGMVELKFASGQTMLFIVPKNQNGLLREIAEDPQTKSLRFVLGDLVNRPAYDQYATLLNTTPSSIRAFGPRAEAIRGEVLLTIKAIALPPMLRTGAFSFEFPDERGFQIGNPWQARQAQLEIFDENGGSPVEIICTTINESVKLTQPELNRILTSLHAETKDSSASATPSSNATASTPHLLATH